MADMSGTEAFVVGRGGSLRPRFATPIGKVREFGLELSTLLMKRLEHMIELLII
jgi:hypothetical protein